MRNGARFVLAIPLLLFILLAAGGTFVSDYPLPTTAFFPDASAKIDLGPQDYTESCCIVVMNDSLRQIVVQTNGSISVRIVPQASPSQPVFDIFTAQMKQSISLPRGVFLITARNEGSQRITGSVVSYVSATHIAYRYKNWGIMARAYSPIVLVSLGTLVLSTRVKERAGLPLRCFLEWAIPIGAYFALVSFVASALSADALQSQLKDWDYYKILPYVAETVFSIHPGPAYLILYILTPLLVTTIALWELHVLLSKARISFINHRFQVPILARCMDALVVPGQLFVGASLLGILIVSIAGFFYGTIAALLPPPAGEFARLILEKEAPVVEVPTQVALLFAVGLPIASALYMTQMFWGSTGKSVLWSLGSLGIISLGAWTYLPVDVVVSLLVGQLFALPGLAVGSIVFGLVYMLLDRGIAAPSAARIARFMKDGTLYEDEVFMHRTTRKLIRDFYRLSKPEIDALIEELRALRQAGVKS
jgi:hypothetical protein